jgi:hypothetical protein
MSTLNSPECEHNRIALHHTCQHTYVIQADSRNDGFYLSFPQKCLQCQEAGNQHPGKPKKICLFGATHLKLRDYHHEKCACETERCDKMVLKLSHPQLSQIIAHAGSDPN